jgi:arylsulfatase A-like enzyme
MRRPAFLPILVGALLAPSPCAAEVAKSPPNVLVLIADDLGWRDVGYHGSEIETPHLDRLARGGVRLERHYVYPTCSPTRAGLLTGRNPSRFGIAGPIADRSKASLPGDAVTLARVLKGRGYETALFGKWHLGLRLAVGPRRYGFDRSYGYLHGQIDQYTHLYKNGDRTWRRNDSFVDERGHATDLIAGEAVAFLKAKRKGPFFAWVAFSVPHHPIQEEDRWQAPYRDKIKDASRRLYAASVGHLDAAVGRIVEALEASGHLKDTLILFTSDNGGQKDYSSKTDYKGRHGPYSRLGDNRPWRGWKGGLHEGGIRVPAFVHWSGKLRPAVVRRTVSYLDWFPTVARLAGVKEKPEWKLEGRDVWPLLAGEKSRVAEPLLYWNIPNAAAVVEGDWKLIVPRGKRGAVELYDLTADPREKKNLAEERKEKVRQMRKMLEKERKLDP